MGWGEPSVPDIADRDLTPDLLERMCDAHGKVYPVVCRGGMRAALDEVGDAAPRLAELQDAVAGLLDVVEGWDEYPEELAAPYERLCRLVPHRPAVTAPDGHSTQDTDPGTSPLGRAEE